MLKRFLLLCNVLFFCSLVFLEASNSKPNVVVILADDLGFGDLGYEGNSFVETPHLDKLAEASWVFEDAYSAAPICTPGRAGLLTGNQPIRYNLRVASTHGTPDAGGPALAESQPWLPLSLPRAANYLPLEAETLAEALQVEGYYTGFVGKWHLGGEGYFPSDQGFEVVEDLVETGGVRSYFPPYGAVSNGSDMILDTTPGEYLEHRMAAKAANFIQTAKEPFFLFYSTPLPHVPLEAPRLRVEYYQAKAEQTGSTINATYAAMISELDDSVGKLIETLKQSGRYENTLIVFTSDNGGVVDYVDNTGEQKLSSNANLRGAKGMIYEGGLRVPLLLHLPEQKVGDVSNVPVSGLDVMPTILAAVSPNAANRDLDGESFLPGNLSIDRNNSVYTYWPNYLTSWVWFPARSRGEWAQEPAVAIRRDQWKFIHNFGSVEGELYDLNEDPAESVNLLKVYPEVAEDLDAEVVGWLKSTGMHQPVDNTAYNPRWGLSTWQVFGFTHWISRDSTFKIVDGNIVLDCMEPSPLLRCLIPNINKAGAYTLRIRARGKTQTPMAWLLYFADKKTRKVAIPETLQADWQEYTVSFETDQPIVKMDLNLPRARGEVEIDWIQVEKNDGTLLFNWQY